MATITRNIDEGSWQKITSSACTFQGIGEKELKVTESSSLPSVDTKDYKIALPREMYNFEPVDGSLYAMAEGSPGAIAFDLV